MRVSATIVKKGQLFMEVQSNDVSVPRRISQAVADERLAQSQLESRQTTWRQRRYSREPRSMCQQYGRGCQSHPPLPRRAVCVSSVSDKNHPGATVKVYAPAPAISSAQNVTMPLLQRNLRRLSSAFTIADSPHVWIICDVYENDLL